ncbi:MAG: hypothetical protein COA43_09120 [Robiginitomaculum sp.]|nr:MAG: hypothetical protein COA43_09120 [Robiginitomaculum sp.]
MADTSKLFNDKSDLYAKARPTYPYELFEFMMGLCEHHRSVWDCATGNGQAALGLSQCFDNVCATDISETQIANHLDIENTKFSVSPAEKTEFDTGMFDCVNVAQALHWFDFDEFWPEVKRVLKPTGLFITYSYGWFVVTKEIDEIIEDSVKSVIAPYWAPQNQLVIDGYRDVVFPFEKLTVPDISISTQWDFSGLMNYLHTWSATRRCMQDQGDSFFVHAEAKLKQAWGDPSRVRTATAPLTIIAGYPNK